MSIHTINLKQFFLLYMLITFTGLASCKKGWLDAKSDQSLVVPSSLPDLQGLLDDPFTMTTLFPTLGEDAADGHYVTDATIQSIPSSQLYVVDAFTWSKTVSYTSIFDWNDSYKMILIDNIVLDGLNKLNPISLEQQQWNDIKGQALFHRARVFFELSQIYAPSYNTSTAKDDMGIVMRLSSDITIPSKRSTVKDTYDQIIKDLIEARDLLPIRPKILTRGSASAVNALLARVYLSMEDYENAFQASDKCLKLYSELLDYNQISSDAMFIGRFNKEVLLHSNFSPTLNFAYSPSLIDSSLFELYSNDDLRRTRFYRHNIDGSKSFKGIYDDVTYYLFNGLATDEVYLTRAECNARAGRTSDAMKDLNDLMIKRWNNEVSFPVFTADNPQEALSQILTERKKELIFRGVRWMDLRRLNKDPQFAVTLKRTILNTEYILEPNSYKYTFPIPDDIIQHTGIQQNPGWE